MKIHTGAFWLISFSILTACGGGDGAGSETALVADAGMDQNVMSGSTVRLDASGSAAANGDALSYAWSIHSLPPGSVAVLSDATTVHPTFTADLDGIYVLGLQVSNDSAESSPDMVTVTATSENSAPIAVAGADQHGMTGTPATLDGSESTDANGDALSYLWSIQSAPAGSAAVLSDPQTAMPTFTADTDGVYVFRLVVNDGVVDSAPDTVSVTATSVNSAPVANAGKDQIVMTGSTVRLDGSGSVDANGDALSYSWRVQSSPAGSSATLSNAATADPEFAPDLEGAYVFRLVVNDGIIDSAPDNVIVTVTAATVDFSVTVGKFGAGISGTESKWWGGVRGPDDRIYGVPFSADNILIIDPVTNTATRRTMGASISGSGKWASGCLGPDGKIYCVPYNAREVLIIDPIAGAAVRTDFGLDLSDNAKWAGAVLGEDNRIYCIPRNSKDILIIDPLAGTATRSTMGANLAGSNKWSGGILASNGKIYGVPRDSSDILIIDPASGTASRGRLGAALTDSHKYAEGILAPNGKIYAIPYTNSPAILIIDPRTDTASLSTMGANLSGSGWSEAILGPDDRIYAVPYTASDILVIDPASGAASRTPVPGVGRTSTGKWVMGDLVENKFFGIPYGSEEIILVEFGAGEE